MHRLTASAECAGGPCPDLTADAERGMTGGRAYVTDPVHLDPEFPATPPGEIRWEMPTREFERLLAVHISEAQWERIGLLREQLQAQT